MPDLLTCATIAAKILTLAWSLASWTCVGFSLRFREQPLRRVHGHGAALGPALFVGLMGWLD